MKSSAYPGIIISVAIVLAPVLTHAQNTIPERGPIPFSAYDQNGDGLISEKEFMEVRAARMSSRAAEGRPMRGAARAPAFSDFDTDGDGQLTPNELTAGQNAQMQVLTRQKPTRHQVITYCTCDS